PIAPPARPLPLPQRAPTGGPQRSPEPGRGTEPRPWPPIDILPPTDTEQERRRSRPPVTLILPPQKAVYLDLYAQQVARRLLQHSINREERDTRQQEKWGEIIRTAMPTETWCWGVALHLSDLDIRQ